ncbi:aspartyl/asparaginyl beta-hydroxylase domain-containing protein [Streptomyces sp. DG2A-72]|uniref:aspartyl/asparaginyl beta-hydroxylase domain-containing protein n=1 Tax=Streptomyces sp. DG2A-72 TaxID=3051386 RepID=UPI00265C645E|nr:aspartyl/asparaginyl beta-hydroxylase domain-containing protein [Streptomyces sp. DG2A-72]MDO0936603.1 aspartyl/asparaginyl beta-hydroxylase domain-containing protein [Streptomyces sp. DG2A-72]
MSTPERTQPAPLVEAARLACSFDADRLQSELAKVSGHRWKPQRIHAPGGSIGQTAAIDWRVLPLRSPGGDPDRTDPGGPGPVDFAPTVWMERLPYLRELLDGIPAPLNAVRLMALGPGAASRPHRDPKYALHRGFMRLHIPLVTHPGAVLVLDGVEHCWQPGEFWYGDFSREHLVRNTGPATRVHAVIDALLTRELAELFPVDWQIALARAGVLFNQPAPAAAACPIALPYPASLPSGLTDFDHDQPLDGPLQPVQLSEADGHLSLTTADRAFALVPVGQSEFRFAGWSEQRTLQLTDDGVVLRARHGRQLTERRLPAAARTR